jgi:hypothetical protein
MSCKDFKSVWVGCNGEKTIHELIINNVIYIIKSYKKIIE